MTKRRGKKASKAASNKGNDGGKQADPNSPEELDKRLICGTDLLEDDYGSYPFLVQFAYPSRPDNFRKFKVLVPFCVDVITFIYNVFTYYDCSIPELCKHSSKAMYFVCLKLGPT